MKRAALLAGLVLAAVAVAQFPQHRLFDQPNLQRFTTAVASLGWGDPSFFRFASPDSGYRGLDTAVDLCDTLAAGEKVGNWWCFRGDGGMLAGSMVTLAAVGAPVAAMQTVVPSGPTGGAFHTVRYASSSDRHESYDGGPSVSRGMTVCALFQTTTITDTIVASDWSGSAATENWYINGQGKIGLIDTVPVAFLLGDTFVTAGAWHISCGVVEANGTPVQYRDGTASSTGAATVRATAALNTTARVNYNTGGGANNPTVRGVFQTETPLSAARMSAIAHAVLADTPRGVTSDGDAGVAVAVVRSSVKNCPVYDNGWGPVSTLPANRACISMGGLRTDNAGTNNALQSETLCTAPWVNMAPCTANAAIAPNSTRTAEMMYHDGGATQCWTQPLTTSSLTRHGHGYYLLGGTSAAATVSLTGVGNSAGDCTASTASLDAGAWYRLECTSPAAYAAGLTAATLSVCADAPGTLYVWGAQHETGKLAAADKLRAYYPTTSAAGTWVADVPSATPPGIDTRFAAGGTFAMGATLVGAPVMTNGQGVLSLNDTASDTTPQGLLYTTSDQAAGYMVNNSPTLCLTGVNYPAGGSRYWQDTTHRCALGSTIGAADAGTLGPAIVAIQIGTIGNGTGQPNGWVTDVCLDIADGGCVR